MLNFRRKKKTLTPLYIMVVFNTINLYIKIFFLYKNILLSNPEVLEYNYNNYRNLKNSTVNNLELKR